MRMKLWRSRWVFLGLILCLGWLMALTVGLAITPPAIAAEPKHYTELTFPPLPEVKVPPHERFELKNGLVVYLMEDHELPLVSGKALIRTGDRFEPSKQVGLASLTAEVMRSGGTVSHPADDLNQRLEQRAASVEIGMDAAVATGSFSTLSEDLNDVFGLFAEVLREPALPQDKLDLAKQQHKGGIERRNDDPDDISNREFKKLIYGFDSPYGRTEEYQTLNAVSREDVKSFYQQSFHPNCTLLGIVGDFNPQQMRSLIESRLGNWPTQPTACTQTPPTATQVQKGGVFVVDQPQLTQSSVLIGQLGGKVNDPDVFALYVMNEALNSFGGRLFNEVRSRLGLAYSVYAVWSPHYDYPGLFFAGGQTRSEATVPFVKAVQSELEKVRQAPLTSAELAFAKESILNSFVFNFVDPAQTLTRLMRYEYFNYPKDFIFQYQQAVKTMTAQKVLTAAKRSLRSEDMVVLVVGNRQAIAPKLETLNPTVTEVDVSIRQ